MKIIGADERLAEKRGVKILIAGPTGVGTRGAYGVAWCHRGRR